MTVGVTLDEAAPLVHALMSRVAETAHVRILAIKGPLLAEQGLRAPRASADVDVLVDPARPDDFVDALDRVGWRRTVARSVPGIMPAHSVNVVNDHWPVSVDVHHYFPGFLAPPIEVFEELWAHRRIAVLANAPVVSLDLVAHAALVALHYLREAHSQANQEALQALIGRAEDLFSADDRAELVRLAEATDALATLSPFLGALGVSSPRTTRDPAGLAAWASRVQARGSDAWLYRLERTPKRQWPRLIWRSVMLPDEEIIEHHGGRYSEASLVRLRLRRLVRAVRSVSRSVARRLVRRGGAGRYQHVDYGGE